MSFAHWKEGVMTDKLNYTLLEEVLKIGGQLNSTVDLITGELEQVSGTTDEERSGATPAGRPSGEGAPLSTPHISPFIEWTAGASLLKVSLNKTCPAMGGGKRGKIQGFSKEARLRMMRTLAKVKRDVELPCFVTLTYPFLFPSPMDSKKHLDIFLKRFRRAFPMMGLIWKLEPQERGAPHYHMLVWGCNEKELKDYVPQSWHDIAGGGDKWHLLFHEGLMQGTQHCVSKVENYEHMQRYATKYLAKSFDVAGWHDIYPGRFWAMSNKENIPFALTCVYAIPERKVFQIMRYMRRFAKLKPNKYSLTIMCNADKWIQNTSLENL